MRTVRAKLSFPQIFSGFVIFLTAIAAARFFCLSVRAGKAVPESCSSKQLAPTETWCFPLETTAWRISDAYGWRNDPFTGEESFHHGIDLACAEGTPVLASMNGVVVSAQYSTTYGNVLRICHSGGQETLYAHMQYLYVRTGEIVQSGQLIGTVGQTGRATGAHLHIELHQRGTTYDPSKLLN